MEDDYHEYNDENEHTGDRRHSLQFRIACGAFAGTIVFVAIPIAFGSKEPVKTHHPPANPVSYGIYNNLPTSGGRTNEHHVGNAWMTDAALGTLALAGLGLGSYVMRRPKPLSEQLTETTEKSEPLDLLKHNESGISDEEMIKFEEITRSDIHEDPNQK